jgi:hypothetical protein
MDILGINGSSDNVFIKHSSQSNCWMSGEDEHRDIVHILIDPSTIKTGWGIYEGGYHWQWDDKPGVAKSQPTSEHKRAFSVWMYTKEHKAKLWRRFSWGESQGFNSLCATFWNDINANPGKVVHVKYTGAKVEKFKVGQAAIPEFEFVQWVDKPEDFVFTDMDAEPVLETQNTNSGFDFANPSSQTITPQQGDPRFDPSAKLTEDDLPF